MPNCALLHNHLCMGTDNKWRICCKFRGEHRPRIASTSFKDFKSSQSYTEVVETMKTGWHPGCRLCKEDEESGLQESLRQVSNRAFSQNEGIESIELAMTIECNLKCRMCGPKYSSKWVELIDNNPPIIQAQRYSGYDPNDRNISFSIEQILGDKDLSNLKMVKYLGGEPFVSKQLYDLFELLENRNIIGQVEFQTNTNCTLFPTKYVNYLNKFKNLVITLSIDGFEDLNEYIRDGKPWDVVLKAFKEWKEYKKQHHKCLLLLVPSVQAYNIHDLTNLKKFASLNDIKFKFQHVRDPKHLYLNAVPNEYLLSVRDETNYVFIDRSSFDVALYADFVKYTKMLDLANHKDLRDYVPLLGRYVY